VADVGGGNQRVDSRKWCAMNAGFEVEPDLCVMYAFSLCVVDGFAREVIIGLQRSLRYARANAIGTESSRGRYMKPRTCSTSGPNCTACRTLLMKT